MIVKKAKFKGRDGEGNYGAGFIGFSMRDNNLISLGICLFTREEASSINVSHSFYVVDEHTIIEAEFNGVVMSDPVKYFNDPNIHVFFKKPIHLSPEYIQKMTEYAYTLVGKGYDYGLVVNFLYQWFMVKVLGREISTKSPPLLDNPNALMCSEVSASTMDQILEYSNLLPLSEWHPARLSPEKLFYSPELFEEWKFIDDNTLTP